MSARRWLVLALALGCVPKQEQRPDEGAVAEQWAATPDVPSAAPAITETEGGKIVVSESQPAVGGPAPAQVQGGRLTDEDESRPASLVQPEEPPPPPPVKLVTEDPEVRAAFQRGVDASRSGNYPAAEQELKAVVEKDASLDYAWTNLGIVEERMGRVAEAERAYQKATTLKPDQDAAWEAQALLYARTGRAVRMEAQLRESISEHPENLAIRNALVTVLVSQTKYETAINEAKKVLKADEKNVHAMQQLAQAYAKQGKLELSRMVLENARAIDSGDATTQNLLGNVYLALKQRPQAMEAYQKAAQLRPDFVEALNNYGVLLNQAQDYEAATHQLEKAVAAAPDFVPAHLNLGNAYRGLQQFEKALEQYRKAERLRPQPDVYFNLAILHLDADGAPLDPIDRLRSAIAYFNQYKDKGGRDERVEQYLKDAQKGIEKEERRREREKKDQLRKAAEKEAAELKAATEAQKAAEARRAAEEKAAEQQKSTVEVEKAAPPPESGKLRDQSQEK
ncbi:MAG TPA: tetratricopeptide repeat protein [Myxococcaceae bacterium]|jgi:tetratricopeptide (TPR) repeat protein